jgi:predicted dehydrogenase
MKHSIRFGIIGCSNVARNSFLPALVKSKKAHLEFLGSRSKGKGLSFSKQFHCKNFGSYEKVLENESVDAVYISLPPSLQEQWIIRAANAGKHIICEKSATTSFQSAKKMLNVCKKNHVRIMEGFSFLYHPQHFSVMKYLKQNKIGDYSSLNAKFSFNLDRSSADFRLNKELGGGILNDVACYIIKISTVIFQGIPNSILCNLVYDKKYDIDIQGSVYMSFKNNKVATGFFGYSNPFQSSYEIWGEKGLLNTEKAFVFRRNRSKKISLSTNNSTKTYVIQPSDQFQLMIENFCNSLTKTVINQNYEKDLLNQAYIMEYARKSASQMKLIKIKNY